MLRIILILAFCLPSLFLRAQDYTPDAAFTSRLRLLADSLRASYHASFFEELTDHRQRDVKISEKEIRRKLKEIDSEIPFNYSPAVSAYLEFFLNDLRDETALMLAMAPNYLVYIEEQLRAAGMPDELKWLPAVLSFMNPAAFTPDGYSGLWQLPYLKAKNYNMKISSYIDTRRDFKYSTDAALKYLGELYSVYNDWELGIAAYLSTPSIMNKAIRRGGHAVLDSVYDFLPPAYRDVVPAYTAIVYIATNRRKLNLTAPPVNIPESDTAWIKKPLYFGQISLVLDISTKQLREINPVYRHGFVPAGKDSFMIFLPKEKKADFVLYRDSVYTAGDSIFFLTSMQDAVAISGTRLASRQGSSSEGSIIHTVRQGENLSVIASRYRVNVNQIMRWNNLRNTTIRIGQRLTIYTHNPPPVRTASSNQTGSATSTTTDFVWYTVKSGESLHMIAQRYQGVTADDLIRLNNISNPRNLRVGQRIKIPQR